MQNLYNFKKHKVLELTAKDFKGTKVIHPSFKDKHGLICFYAPWCPHCKTMVNDWSEVAKNIDCAVTVAAVNCEKNKDLAKRFKVQGLPTIYWTDLDGNICKYDGPRGPAGKVISYACISIVKNNMTCSKM